MICAVTAALTIGVQAVLPALPSLQRVFGISDAASGWFTLAFTLPGLVLTVPLTAVAARAPRRWVIAGLMTSYGLLGAAQGMVGGYAELLVLRVLQGCVFAATMPLMVVIVGESWVGSRQSSALALRGTWIAGAELALPVAGALLATLSWQAPFVAQVCVLPLAVVALFALDDRRSSSPLRQARGSLRLIIGHARHGWTIMLIGFAGVFRCALDRPVPTPP